MAKGFRSDAKQRCDVLGKLASRNKLTLVTLHHDHTDKPDHLNHFLNCNFLIQSLFILDFRLTKQQMCGFIILVHCAMVRGSNPI